MLSAAVSQAKTTVLVVDDSSAMRRYLRLLLELDSYQVETANNGADALRLLREGFSPTLVLLDLEMPGMDGLKTLRRLLKLKPELKVIMCSGVDDPRKVERAAALGARGYVTKPVKHLYLSAAIENCLRPSAGGRKAAKGSVIVMPAPPPA
jgi:two-component system, NarL family, invasion response regulator UvrY